MVEGDVAKRGEGLRSGQVKGGGKIPVHPTSKCGLNWRNAAGNPEVSCNDF
jgi:hypothetical protein